MGTGDCQNQWADPQTFAWRDGRHAGPGRLCAVKMKSSSRCRKLSASRSCPLPASPETAPHTGLIRCFRIRLEISGARRRHVHRAGVARPRWAAREPAERRTPTRAMTVRAGEPQTSRAR